jgi:hypothetical protein
MSDEMWGHRTQTGRDAALNLVGFKVEALDGHIGRIDKHSNELGEAFLVVDTGVWIFGKHVLLPAGLVSGIDVDARRVHVEASKSQIESAPEFDPDKHVGDAGYKRLLEEHYGRKAV